MSVSDGLEFESDIQSDKPASESGNLATHLSQELKIVSDEEIATKSEHTNTRRQPFEAFLTQSIYFQVKQEYMISNGDSSY